MTRVVADSIRLRLEEEDLRGPWDPLTPEEEEQLRLSGRWPGHNIGGLLQRNYELPSTLLTALRTAAWRVSEGPLGELEEKGLTLYSQDLSLEEMEEREELIERVYSPPRIVREALDRYRSRRAAAEGEGAE
ncbi:hypothetical protein ACIQ9R_36030 [Streptomyces sp. NPDC094447]|uniref:hypothetical protein n=1 Tax=Streptomyces sp. NPDC094447 TaxID=3366062 RepID=UPI003828F93E